MVVANSTLYFSNLFQEEVVYNQLMCLQLLWHPVWQSLYYRDVKDYWRPFKIQNITAGKYILYTYNYQWFRKKMTKLGSQHLSYAPKM